ncbi:MAG: DUF2855 family protein [Pseudomonadota bacterium]
MDSLLVNKAALDDTTLTEAAPSPTPVEGEVLLRVDRFGLSANNISYADVGEALGYWAYFSPPGDLGSVPVWGFADVVESAVPGLEVGERLFGYLPMASEFVIRPANVEPLILADASEQRAPLHPWYNRYYRCSADPLYDEQYLDLQPILWALFMTGLMMAEELANAVDAVVISSASSKTALSLAWSLQALNPDLHVVGLTSAGNSDFVAARGVYDTVTGYEDLALPELPPMAFVDIAGNASITAAVHEKLGERLKDSVTIGATHRAPTSAAAPLPGPTPRFFFIPDVAEAKAAEVGFENYHRTFAEHWASFAPWAAAWCEFERHAGAAAVEAAYQRLLAGQANPARALILSWT